MSDGLDTNIKLGVNYTEVTGSVSDINRQLRVLDSEFKKTAEQAKAFGDASGELAAKQIQLTQKVELQTAKVAKLKEQYTKAREEKGENSKAVANLAIKYNQAEASLAKMQGTLKETTDKVNTSSSAIGKLGQEFDKFKAKADEIGIKFDKIGRACQAVGIAFTALGVGAAKSMLDFENSFKMTSTLIDENVMNWDTAREGILTISDATGKAADNLSVALYDALSSGIETGDSLKFLKDSADLARAGFTETSVSVDILTTILSSYGMKVADVTKISDKLILTQNAGKITVGQLGNDFGRVAGIAAQAKVPIDDLFAAIATLTKNGVGASESVTQLRGILSAVIKPTAEAKEEATKLGLKFSVAALQSKGLAGFLAEVQRKTHGNIESFGKLFGNVESLNGSLILTGKGAKDFNEILGQMQTATGLTAKALSDLDKNKGEQFNKALNEMKNSLIGLGETLAPFISMVSTVISLLSKLPTPVLAVIAVLGPVLIIVGQIIAMVANFKSIFGAVGKVGEVASLGMSEFGKKLLIVLGIVVAVAAAITILILAINALTGKSGAFVSQMNAMSNVKMPSVSTPNMPGFAVGINRLPNDTYAMLHKDEAVIPAQYNPYNPNASMPNGSMGAGGNQYITVNVAAKDLHEAGDVVNLFNQLKQSSRRGTYAYT